MEMDDQKARKEVPLRMETTSPDGLLLIEELCVDEGSHPGSLRGRKSESRDAPPSDFFTSLLGE